MAPITGNQTAAVAWVRLSGPEAWEVAAKVFKAWPENPISHKAVFGTYVHGDSGLALPFAHNQSYTGEEAVELSLHGSTVSVRNLVETCLSNGARMAEPGEFTLRAFLNGRLDLTQAEAVRDTVDAQTDAQLRSANYNRKGVLRREITTIRDQILTLLVRVEASVDFSEEIGDVDKPQMIEDVQHIVESLNRWIDTADSGKLIRNGFRVAIVGPPNAGKSSLLNALLGEDRSIVTDIPGTTRDYVEEMLEIGGLPVVLIDTAGLRQTNDIVESLGIQRTRAIAADADAVWYLYDASLGWSSEDQSAVDSFDRPVTILANKVDIANPDLGMPISALTRTGLAELLGSLSDNLQTASNGALINLRHKPLLEQARSSMIECESCINNLAPDDLLSVLLTDAASHLGAVTGETATPDMIDRIFHDFCIGK